MSPENSFWNLQVEMAFFLANVFLPVELWEYFLVNNNSVKDEAEQK